MALAKEIGQRIEEFVGGVETYSDELYGYFDEFIKLSYRLDASYKRTKKIWSTINQEEGAELPEPISKVLYKMFKEASEPFEKSLHPYAATIRHVAESRDDKGLIRRLMNYNESKQRFGSSRGLAEKEVGEKIDEYIDSHVRIVKETFLVLKELVDEEAEAVKANCEKLEDWLGSEAMAEIPEDMLEALSERPKWDALCDEIIEYVKTISEAASLKERIRDSYHGINAMNSRFSPDMNTILEDRFVKSRPGLDELMSKYGIKNISDVRGDKAQDLLKAVTAMEKEEGAPSYFG